MSKGQLTRENIISQAAALFNSRGYSGASMSELMEVTGLKKGGIYNHFESKEEILIAAFEYSVKLLNDKLQSAIEHEKTATGRLRAIVEYYRQYPLNPVIQGGCPILNFIVEADNTNRLLKKKVQEAVDNLIKSLARLIASGIKRGEFKAGVDAEKAAIFIIAAIEGGVAISRNYDNNLYMEVIIEQLLKYIDEELIA